MDARHHDDCSCHAPSANELRDMLAKNPERLVPRAQTTTVTALLKALDTPAPEPAPAPAPEPALEPQ